ATPATRNLLRRLPQPGAVSAVLHPGIFGDGLGRIGAHQGKALTPVRLRPVGAMWLKWALTVFDKPKELAVAKAKGRRFLARYASVTDRNRNKNLSLLFRFQAI